MPQLQHDQHEHPSTATSTSFFSRIRRARANSGLSGEGVQSSGIPKLKFPLRHARRPSRKWWKRHKSDHANHDNKEATTIHGRSDSPDSLDGWSESSPEYVLRRRVSRKLRRVTVRWSMEDDSSRVLAFGDDEKESSPSTNRERGPFTRRDSELTDLPVEDNSLLSEDSSLAAPRHDQPIHSDEGNTFDEDAMNAHLADVESSFLPEGNASNEHSERAGVDDTYLELGQKGMQKPAPDVPTTVQRDHEMSKRDLGGSEPEVPSSSPTAAVARRVHSRNFSTDSAIKPGSVRLPSNSAQASSRDSRSGTPSTQRPLSQGSTVRQDYESSHSSSQISTVLGTNGTLASSRLRPSKNRQVSSQSTISDVSGGEGGLDIDYALHTGGSLSTLASSRSAMLSRLPSLGSVASSIAGEGRRELMRGVSGSSLLASGIGVQSHREDEERPETPRANPSRFTAPTDTIIAQHVQSIQVPETVARDFRARNQSTSPNKRITSSDLTQDRTRRALTLKEQNNKVDKLTKENFDLKLKIHFLDQALQNRSDDGVKDLIDQNVQFQTDLANERKETQTLRRKMREMERKMKDQDDALTQALQQQKWSKMDDDDDPSLQAEMHEEILILRQKLDHSENTISTLREDLFTTNTERRKMSETIKSMASRRSEDNVGMKETISTWEDLLNAAEGQREQAEEDAQRLREELNALRLELASPAATRNGKPDRRRGRLGSAPAPGEGEDSDAVNDLRQQESHTAQVEQLRHEISELRKQLGAQTNMLSSRNREKEMMSQEISDLKLIIDGREGGRSMAGESIFDRSVSRAHHHRAASRASDHTGATQVTEAERDIWDKKEGQLRDQNAELRIKYQELERTHGKHLEYITAVEDDFEALEKEFHALSEDIRQIQTERDEALQAYDEREAEYNQLKEEALTEIEGLDEDKRILQAQLEEALSKHQKTHAKLQTTSDGYKGLQGELREITQSVMNLEDEKQANMRTIQTLEQQMAEAEDELQKLEQKCSDLDDKRLKLEVDQEGLQNEIKFLRAEQEGHMLQIGDLEHSLHHAQQTISDEQEKLRDMEEAMVEERQQRDVLENKSKEEVQKVLDDLNADNAKSKDQIRTLRRSLSAKEVEANSWRQKLEEYERSLCDVLGDRSGSKQSILGDIEKLQQDLDTTANELDRAKMDLADKDRLLRHRDGLLESTSLESRRLSDLLDKERTSRKHDLDSFEKASRGQASHLRTIAQQESRMLELETTYTQQQRKMASLEEQYREQMHERNTLLMALWNRLSTLCGAEWAQTHSLVNGEIPSVDVILKHLPAFHRNVISAVKQVEKIIGDFKLRIRRFEKEVLNDYQTLNNNLDIRLRRIDAVERAVEEHKRTMAEEAARPPPTPTSRSLSGNKLIKGGSGEESAKLKNEIKLLKAELKFHRQHPSAMAQQMLNQQMQLQHPEHVRRGSSAGGAAGAGGSSGSKKDTSASPARQIVAQLLRHHSTHAVEQLAGSGTEDSSSQEQQQRQPKPIALSTSTSQPSDQRWQARMKEMERRLKAEREGRLLDRQGARQRLEEGRAENEELRSRLEREMERRSDSQPMDLAGEDGEHAGGSEVGSSGAAVRGQAKDGSLD